MVILSLKVGGDKLKRPRRSHTLKQHVIMAHHMRFTHDARALNRIRCLNHATRAPRASAAAGLGAQSPDARVRRETFGCVKGCGVRRFPHALNVLKP